MTDHDATSREAELNTRARRFFDRPPPGEYLENWAARLAQPEEVADQHVHSVVLFRLHHEYLALDTRSLIEVSAPRPIHTIPHRTGSVLLGLVNMRGQLRICVSLHGLLGVEPDSTPTTNGHHIEHPPEHTPESEQRMLIVQDRNDPWVFPVEQVLGIVRPADSDIREVPATFGKASSFSRAVFSWKDRTVGYIDEVQLFASLRSACS